MDEPVKKNNNVLYTLKICFNPDTDEVIYVAEGLDDSFDFSEISPYDLDRDCSTFFTTEDMETIKRLYNIEES